MSARVVFMWLTVLWGHHLVQACCIPVVFGLVSQLKELPPVISSSVCSPGSFLYRVLSKMPLCNGEPSASFREPRGRPVGSRPSWREAWFTWGVPTMCSTPAEEHHCGIQTALWLHPADPHCCVENRSHPVPGAPCFASSWKLSHPSLNRPSQWLLWSCCFLLDSLMSLITFYRVF